MHTCNICKYAGRPIYKSPCSECKEFSKYEYGNKKTNADIVMVQEWVSVKDRLPEPEQGVILCTREIETYGKHYEKKKIYRNIYMGYFDGNEWLTSYCHGCEYIFRMNEKYPNETIEVTHWMPLPSTEGLE